MRNDNTFYKCVAALAIGLLIITVPAFSQNGVGINATSAAADVSAMLDVVSSSKGALLPRMTASQRTSISSPATGLIVYQTDGTTGFYYNSGTSGSPVWVRFADGTGTAVTSVSASSPLSSSGGATPNITLSGTVPVANGGTGATTQQAAINALAGSQSSGTYLRSDGTNTSLSAISASDVPTLNQNTTGTASNVTGTVAVNHGGTGATTQQTAIDALLPSQTSNSGKFLTTNGTTSSWATASGGGAVGQSSNQVFQTSSLVSVTTSYVTIPGLTQTLTVPSSAIVLISASVAVTNTSGTGSSCSRTDITVFIDGVGQTPPFYQGIQTCNTSTIGNCWSWYSAVGSVSLSAGTHTILLAAERIGSTTSTIGGSTNPLQGVMTVVFLKQ